MNWQRYLVPLAAVASIAAYAIETASPQTRSVGAANELSLQLNIPAFRLDVFEGRSRIRSHVVAVGSARYPTPRGNFLIRQITWNPWWYPPPQPWARHEKITRPGPSNPMGKVKLHLGGGFYLHGTPAISSIGSAASHGCVRMNRDDVVGLAKLVQNATGAAIADASVDSLLSSWAVTRTVDIPHPIPVRFVYDLAEVRDDSLLLHPDIYHLRKGTAEAAALRALAPYTRDTSRVDHAALRLLIQRARTRHASIPIAQLFPNVSLQPKTGAPQAWASRITFAGDGNAHASSVVKADCGGNTPGTSFRQPE